MTIRDNLLVNAGARAGYMHITEDIKLPDGTDFKFEFNGKIVSATL